MTEDQETSLVAKAGGRKYTLSLLIVFCATAMVYHTKIDAGVYATIIVATIGAYIAGNVYQNTNTK